MPRRESAAILGRPVLGVTVRCGDYRYGLLAGEVLEVQRMVALTPVPEAPASVEGVFDLRGRVVPVLDLRKRLELAAAPPRVTDYLIVVRAGRRVVAVRADPDVGLVEISPDELDESLGGIPGLGQVVGAATTSEGILLIHDLERFLSWDEAEALEAALPEGAASDASECPLDDR